LVNISKPAVAIFGGSFDPPHRGHQAIVQKAIEKLDIDKLIVLPAYLNPFKNSSLANAEQRLNWCHELFDNNRVVFVSDYEVEEGKSVRTSQSVKHFNREFFVKYLVIGSDNLSTLADWYEFEWLNSNIIWVIFTRKDYPLYTSNLREFIVLELNEDVNSTEIRDKKILTDIDNKIKNSVKQTIKG